MKKPWLKKVLTQLLKASLTVLALYFIYTKIDFQAAWKSLQEAKPIYLVGAFFLFVASKAASAMRLNDHFASIPLKISPQLNLKLYALGMYYNLFLPGGIGGDGYKAYWLNKQYKTPVKRLVSALLLDRISGLIALLVLACLISGFVSLPWIEDYKWLIPLAIIALYIGHYWGLKILFSSFLPTYLSAHSWSLLVQILQLLCMGCLYHALDPPGPLLSYAFVFLLSSIVSVLPLTIGGIGSREVVFLFGAEWLSLNQDIAVTISLLFYGITALTSFLGSYFAWVPSSLVEKQEVNQSS